jgi:hypothetical protein
MSLPSDTISSKYTDPSRQHKPGGQKSNVIKIISGAVIGALFVYFVSSFFRNNTPNWEAARNASFSADFEWTEELVDGYISQESQVEVGYSGPFYFGKFAGVDEYTQKYTEARDWRVDQIVNLMGETLEDLNKLENNVKEERGVLDWYAFQMMGLEPELQEPLLEWLDYHTIVAMQNNHKLELMNALYEELQDQERNAEWGFMAYTLHVGTQDLVVAYSDEIAGLHARMAALYVALDSDNKVYADINHELDKKITSVSEDLNEVLHRVYFNGSSLAFEERLLFTADYYYAKDAMQFAQAELDKIDDAIKDYDADKPAIGDDELELMAELHDQLSLVVNDLDDYLDSVPKDKLVDHSELALAEDGIIPVAYAGSTWDWVSSKVRSATNSAKDLATSTASVAWETTKAIASTSKDLAVGTLKVTGQTLGVALDATSATVKSGMDIAASTYYGVSPEDTVATIRDNYSQAVKNFEQGTSGSQVYKDSLAIMEGAENLAQTVVEEAVKLTPLGEGATSATLGFIAKTTVGFVTGGAKDIYVALDPTTSDADTMTALAGLVMTATGGSQSILKGSQALKIGGTSTKTLLQKTADVVKKLDPRKISKVFKDGIGETLKRGLSMSNLKSVGEGMSRSITNAVKRIPDNAKDTYHYLKGRVQTGVSDTYETLHNSVSIKEGFKKMFGLEVKEGTRATTQIINYLDNIVGSTIDGAIIDQFREGVKLMGVSELGISELNELEQENRWALKETMIRLNYEQNQRLRDKMQEIPGYADGSDEYPQGDPYGEEDDYYDYDEDFEDYVDYGEDYYDEDYYDDYNEDNYHDGDIDYGEEYWNNYFEENPDEDYGDILDTGDIDIDYGSLPDFNPGDSGTLPSYNPYYDTPAPTNNGGDCGQINLGNISDCLETTGI